MGSLRLIKRSDGARYEVEVDLGTDPVTGERRQRSRSFRSKREATAALTRWLSER